MVLRRIDLVRNYVIEDTEKKLNEDAFSHLGVDALTIALDLQLQRTNVSMELNKLWKEGHLVKVQGRPTLYFDVNAIELRFPHLYIPSFIAMDDCLEDYFKNVQNDAFSEMITEEGQRESEEMMTALSAMAYPPNGLSLLVYGDNGVGKAEFVTHLIEKCKQTKIFSKNTRIINYDCQRNNGFDNMEPEKTSNTLFVIKNVQYLNNSGYHLLLDFLDYRAHHRIHSHGKSYPVIITSSESHEAPIIKELIQIVPMHVYLPNLEEILPIQKVEIITEVLKHEAVNLKRNISININLFTIICSHCYGYNKNSVFSEIQKAIASSYYKNMHDKGNTISITFEDLSAHMRNSDTTDFDYAMLLNSFQEEYVFFNSNGKSNIDAILESNLDELIHALQPLITTFKTNGSNLEYDIKFLKELYYSFFPNNKNSNIANVHIETMNKLLNVLKTLPDDIFKLTDKVDVFILYCYILILETGVASTSETKSEDPIINALTRSGILNQSFDNALSSKILNSLIVEIESMNRTKKPQLLIVVDDRNQKGIYEDLLKEFEELTSYIYYAERTLSSLDTNRIINDIIVNQMSPVDTLIITDIYALFRNRFTLKDSLNLNVEIVYPLSLPLLDKCLTNLKAGYLVSDFKNINLQRISDGNQNTQRLSKLDTDDFIAQLNEKLLTHDLSFLDSRKSTPLITASLELIARQLNIEVTKPLITKYLIHCSFMLERVIKNESLTHPKLQTFYINNAKVINIIKSNMRTIEEIYGITIPPMEIAYVAEMVAEVTEGSV